MKNTALILILLLLSQSTIFGQTSKENTFDLAIKNVDVFDSNTKKVLKNKTILVKGNKVASIIDTSQKFKAKKTIKGKGRLVVPGFIDTHTHILQIYGAREFGGPKEIGEDVVNVYKNLIARQYLDKGITTIVDMAQPEGWIEASLKLQQNPSPKFPNLFIAGSSTISELGPNRTPPLHHEQVFNAEDGRKKVRKYAKLGIKYMKLYSRLKEKDMKPIVDEAKKYDITLNAHVDNNVVTIPQAMELGVRNFEHFFTVTPSILNFNKNYPQLNKKYSLKGNWNIDKFAANMVFFFGYIDEKPELKEKMLALFDKMAKENVTISTALNVLASSTDRAYTFSTFDNRPPRNTPNTNYSAEQNEQLKKAFDTMLKYMKTAHEKGVKLRIGTDTRYGGKAFISELMLLSEAGFPIEDILQIATINGAEAMKIADKFGSIELGKNADLVIFDKSPFDDYKNFKSNKTVIKSGKLFKLKKSLAFSLMERIEKDNIKSSKSWFRKHKKTGKYGSLDEAEMNEIGFQLLAKGKILEALAVYRLKKEAFPTPGKVYNGASEDTINRLAYEQLQKKQMEVALKLFTFNVENHPKSSNAYDSLGEVYLANKNKELGLASYKKAIELNPNNFNAVNVKNKLEGRKVTVSDAILDSYIGKYQMSQNRVYVISRDGDKLSWERVGQTWKAALEPVSNERFVFPGTNESILFEKDSDGKTTGLNLDQSGRLTKLKKLASSKGQSGKAKLSEEDAVRIPLNNYLMGHKTRKAEYMRKAFHTEGKLIFIRDGKFTTWDFQDYISRMNSGKIAPDEDQRKRTIESIDIAGNAAIAKLVLDYPTTRFVDYASLLKINGEWKIVSKVLC